MEKKILFIARPIHVTPLYQSLQEQGVQLILLDSVELALKNIQEQLPDFIFVQSDLPGIRVEKLLTWLQENNLNIPVYVFTERGSAKEARKLMEAGAKDYWIAPLNLEKLEIVLKSEQSKQVTCSLEQPLNFSEERKQIIGNHPSIQAALNLAKRIARSKASVLISGESGTGKELFARYIHEHSGRKGAFIAVNCAALPEHLLESELFGHEKGAFTGAIARKPGKFELANHGTILLDEITEMDINLQAKLLRVIQEEEFDRVGGTETIKVDVRIIATTNRDIEQQVKENKFRADLFYRLNVIPLKIPPLRERGEDVILLGKFFISKFCKMYKLPPKILSNEAKKWLLAHPWPGNVRELQNLMERAVLLSQNQYIEVKHFLLDENIFDESNSVQSQQNTTEDSLEEVMPLAEMEKRMILKSLKLTGGNRSQASQLLGISVRTLRNKLNEYKKQGIAIP
ncbi:MAG: sigma-54 dependent transcriptional regulator [Desulfonauticus sp.]|nr:sigma-54 dependent transcriptional regulator [Desulfonauticus sp.]